MSSVDALLEHPAPALRWRIVEIKYALAYVAQYSFKS